MNDLHEDVVETWLNREILDQVRVKLEEYLTLLQKTALKENGVILEAPPQKSMHNAAKKRKCGKKQTKIDLRVCQYLKREIHMLDGSGRGRTK